MRERIKVAAPMLTAVPAGMGGTETYAQYLFRHLASDPQIDLRAIAPRSYVGHRFDIPTHISKTVPGTPSILGRLSSLIIGCFDPLSRRVIAGSDIVHYPFTVPAPLPGSAFYIQTLHDVQHLDLPENFSRAERLYRKATYDFAGRMADAIVTDSEFSRDRIIANLGVPQEKVHSIHLGVDTTDFSFYGGERERILLYPARSWRHKNHARLFEALPLIRNDFPDFRLVLTGGDPDPTWRTIRGVEVLGHVSREELCRLYRRAACLVYPSLYEGFGLPPLEAMASGCPTAVARSGSLPEVCADAAEYFDPTSPADIARSIKRVLQTPSRLIRRGLARANEFGWEKAASSHIQLYCQVAEGRK